MIAFSDDAKFAAFMIYRRRPRTPRPLRSSRQTTYTKALVLNLATGDKADYEKIRSFSFSGENPAWLALHKARPGKPGPRKDKWSGSDLILRELATGKELTFGNVAEFAFDKKGQRLAFVIDAMGQTGNGVELRDMATGRRPLARQRQGQL